MFEFARVAAWGPVRTFTAPLAPIVAVVLAAAGAASGAYAQQTYIALGDSVGFGITTGASYTQLSSGDRGYVAPVADWLASRNGGVRPDVMNLSIFGDDTASFFNTSEASRAINTNYDALFPPTSQASRFALAVAQAAADGRPVTTVTISLGANDLLDVVKSPGFLALPPLQQGAMVIQALTDAANNLAMVYASVRTALPMAEIIAVGYYDPFAALIGNPNPAFTSSAVQNLNAIIEGTAQTVGARYVDNFSAFSGQEAVLTNIQTDPEPFNVHPTPAGYAVMANQIIPSPATAAILAIGAVVVTRRRRVVLVEVGV